MLKRSGSDPVKHMYVSCSPNWIHHLQHDYISAGLKLVACTKINLVSKSLLLFCCCCCSSNEIRMSSKHIKQMRSELNSSIPPIAYRLLTLLLISSLRQKGTGAREWLGKCSILLCDFNFQERGSGEKLPGNNSRLTSGFLPF